MKGSTLFKAASLLSSVFTPLVQAQTNDQFTDPGTNITFSRYTIPSSQTKGGMQWGYALPAAAGGTNDEYIGLLVGSLQTGHKGWSGLSHGGGMPNALLLMAWVDDAGARIKTEFKYAGGYVVPDHYTGNATLTQISQKINETHFTLIYRCQWCWAWNQNGATGAQLPTTEVQVIGWAQNLDNPSTPLTEHNNGQSQFGAQVAPARKADYAKWVAQYGGNGTSPTPTSSPTPPPTGPTSCAGTPAPTATTAYDYIIVGGGAGGIPVAAKLAESGKSVLLIEKGPPSLGRWNGTMKPKWLEGTDLTRFDVPGLCNQIWVDSAGVACTDIDQMAGCVLGGGSAVNAALWWKAVPEDWDYSFPTGWKANDMAAATERVFKTIPGTDHPSMDGKLYYQQGYQVLTSALAADGWKDVTPVNSRPSEKNRTYGLAEFMYVNGQRNGPLATYLVDAAKRKNFNLWMNTAVRRVVRNGSKITGVELDGGAGGYCGTVNVTATGRVILSAGTFGSTKLLFRSGIGPKDQLQIVASSVQDGSSYINSSQWINLPVGKNLNDHVNTDLVVKHPNVSFYDFYAAWTDPIESDKQSYLNNRTGILAQSAPNIGPMFWEVVKPSDGIGRAIQWQARVEPSPPATDNTSMTISQYLGRGSTSRGTLSINGALSMYVSDPPYLKTKEDLEAITMSINNLRRAIAKVPSIEWEVPAANVSTEEFLKSIPLTPSKRRSNHWIGTSKIGTDSGLTGGTSVVDLNTQVYGTDNLHVVDAGLFPGHIVTNPTAYIVVIAEHAAEKILALGGGKVTPPPPNSSSPSKPSSAPSNPSSTSASGSVAAGKQCGGKGYTGPTQCVTGYTCKQRNANYSYCARS